MLFKYMAHDQDGNELVDVVNANSSTDVMIMLKQRQLIVKSIVKVGSATPGGKSRRVKICGGELAVFSRQLSTMVDAGIPLIQCLDALLEQIENPRFKDVIRGVVQSVEGGESFSESLKPYSRVFDSMFVNMVKTGETSGKLSEILNRIATHLESLESLKRKVKSAMMYPVIITIMSLGITAFLILKVIPVFAQVYSDFGGVLPLPTRILLAISGFTRRYLLILSALGCLLVFLVRKYARTSSGRFLFDGLKFRVPVFGVLFKDIAMARFTRTLGTLLHSGVHIVPALEITSLTVGNSLLERALGVITASVKDGENIAKPMTRVGIFPPMVVRMMAVGEKSGKLDFMLEKMAVFYDERVDTKISGLTSIIEPLLIAFLGIVIGGIVICMFLPIFKLSTIVSG